MEIAIAIGIGMIIAAAAGSRKKRRVQARFQNETPGERKRREADELITVVLPTINNGK